MEDKRRFTGIPLRKLVLLALVLALLLGALYLIKPVKTGLAPHRDPDSLSPWLSDIELVQPITVEKPVNYLSFEIATYLETIESGALVVTVSEPGAGEALYTKCFAAPELIDNGTLGFRAALDPGDYVLRFHVEGIDGDKKISLYGTGESANKASLDGEEQNFTLILATRNTLNLPELQNAYAIALLFVSAVVALALFLPRKAEAGIEANERRTRLLRTGLAFLCLLAAGLLLFLAFLKLRTDPSVAFLRDSRLAFYGLVVLFSAFFFLAAGDRPWACWGLAGAIGLVLLFADLKYSVIDEIGHVHLVEFMLANRLRYPNITLNYEAVQGPVYYYSLALLTGWLPEGTVYLGGRVIGLVYLFLFGYITRKTLKVIRRHGLFEIPDALYNMIWLLFVINPLMLIRYTRVSNESLVGVFVALEILLLTEVLLDEDFDARKVWLATACCALAFLTKATAVFMFGFIFLVCAYYRKWALFVKQTLLYALMLAPWFLNNYRIYGALTAIQGHLDFVLPIVNPNLEQPDLWADLIGYFRGFFLNGESGFWYDYYQLDIFVNVLLLLLLTAATLIALRALYDFLRNRLRFDYSKAEKKRVLFLSYTALPVVMLIMHAFQSVATLNDSLGNNRYGMLLCSVFCAMLLIGMSPLSERWKKFICCFVCLFYSYSLVSMICGYTEIVSVYWLGK